MKKWQIAVSILLVFALGTAVGAYGSKIIFKSRVNKVLHSEGTPGIKVLQGMVDRLDLSESQRTSINTILDENNKKWETIRQEYEPQIKELFQTVIEETKKVLTPEQREAVEQMSANVQRRFTPRTSTPPRATNPDDKSVPPGGATPPRSSVPPETSGAPDATTPPEASAPPEMAQTFGPKTNSERIAGIIEQLKLDKDTSAAVRSIIESDIQKQDTLRDGFEKSQSEAEAAYRKDVEESQLLVEKKLLGILTPEQMEAYRQLRNPEAPRPDDFGFDGHGDNLDRKDFKQDALVPPEGDPGQNQQGNWTL